MWYHRLYGLSEWQVHPDGSIHVAGQISGNAIENIEVITVPTAKYDAQGKGGIINITTRTSGIEGLSVSTNVMGGGARILDTTNNAYKHMVASGEQIFYQDKLYTRTVTIAEIDISYAFNTNGKLTKKVDSSFGKSEFYAPSAGYDFE